MASYSATILGDSPKAYYRLNETSGVVAHDSTANHYDATLSGSVTFGQAGAISGDSDTSIAFSGVTAGLVLPYTLNYTTFPAFSLEYWIALQGVWQYIAVTCDGPTTVVYLNGAVTSTVTTAFTEISSIFDYAGSYLDGNLDEVAVYNRELLPATIQNHFLAGRPGSSLADAAIYKTQIVKAYTSAGAFIDVVRDAPLLSGFKEAINAATSPLQVVLPRSFDNFDLAGTGGPGTIGQGNIWKYYLFGPGLPAAGKLRYQGVIDAFQPSIDASGAETVTVTLIPQSSAIADHGIGGTQAFTSTDPVTMFNWWFTTNDPITGVPYASPLTLDGTNPASSGVSVTYPFTNETLASAFTTIVQMLPTNWFIRCNPDLSVTLNVTPTTAQHVFYLGQDCAVPQYKQDWTLLKNIVYLTGGAPVGYGPESVTVTLSRTGQFEAFFENSHTGTWNITLDPSFAIAATAPAIAAGVQTITPSSMTNIVTGVKLLVSRGTGASETITVSSTTSSTFTATFATAHSGAFTIQLDPSFIINTTCSTPVGGGGLTTCTPASLTNIIVGVKLFVGVGASNQIAPTSIKQGSDFNLFGERLLLVTEPRVSDQHTLDVLAQGYLTLYDQVMIRTLVRIIDYRGDLQRGLGFDIETIQVGDSCKIANLFSPAASSSSLWDTAVWDQSSWDFAPGTAFSQISVITALTYGFDYVDLEISTLQPNQDAALMSLRNRLQDFTLVQASGITS